MSQQLAEFLNHRIDYRKWSGREFYRQIVEYHGGDESVIGYATVARMLRNDGTPHTDSLSIIAPVVFLAEQGRKDEAGDWLLPSRRQISTMVDRLFELAGLKEVQVQGLSDPQVIHLASRIEQLPPPQRRYVLSVVEAVVDGLHEMGVQPRSEGE